MDTQLVLIIVSSVLSLLMLGATVLFVWSRTQSTQSTLSHVRENLELMQRAIASHQQRFEEGTESRSSQLRTELAQELKLNRQELQNGLAQTTRALEVKVTAIDTRLDQRLGALSQSVQTNLEKNLKEGFIHFEKVQQHLSAAQLQLQNLSAVGQSVHELNNLLKLPHLRGSFGEAMLERLLSDILPPSCYELQYRIVPNSQERVDAVIKYPTHVLPIDSKFPREQVIPLFETNDPALLEGARRDLADAIKIQAKHIRDKYVKPEHGTADMALLFVPSETLYFEILRNAKLCDDLAKLRIFAVSPNTLAVTLQSVAASRTYYEMARGVEKTLLEIKRAKQHFESFERRFEDVGGALNKATDAYQKASTHLSRFDSAVERLTGDVEEKSPAPPAPLAAVPSVDGNA